MLAAFKHLIKAAKFTRLDVAANFKGMVKLALFTNRQPLQRARYRTVSGANRTIPNGSIRHV